MKFLPEHKSKEVLEKYGIKTARCIFVDDEDAAVNAAREIGYPVVMKIVSDEIIHKSQAGGVLLNLRSDDEVRKGFRRLMAMDSVYGVTVQPMLEKGIEVIVGVIENEQFGSVIMFGLGGIFVEVFRDVSFRLIPITKRDAMEMIGEIRGHRIIKNNEMVAELLVKISEVAIKENIVEMDLNPIFVYENDYAVVDARMWVGKRREFEKKVKEIGDLINPKSVAVIGASANPLKVGNAALKSLLVNPKIKVYPVNPKLDEINGIKVYPSVKEIPNKIDLAIVAVPAEKVVSAVKDASSKVKNFVIISSGFREAEYREGEILQNELTEIVKNKNIRIIGPNTFGIVNVVGKINASFTPLFGNLKPGKVALVSQSGGICHYVIHTHPDLGFSYILQLGNRCDVDFPDVLRFLSEDEHTKIVTLYIEGIDDGRGLYREAKKLSEVKPVIAYKAGKSKLADKASKSHTGSLAGDYLIYKGALRQAGVIVTNSIIEMMDLAKALSMFPKVYVGDLALITIQAGLGITSLDIIDSYDVKIAKFNEVTLEKLHTLLPVSYTHLTLPTN